MFLVVRKSGMLCTGITHRWPRASVFSLGGSCPSFPLLGSLLAKAGKHLLPRFVNFSAVPFSMTRPFKVAPTESYPMNLSLDMGDIL